MTAMALRAGMQSVMADGAGNISNSEFVIQAWGCRLGLYVDGHSGNCHRLDAIH